MMRGLASSMLLSFILLLPKLGCSQVIPLAPYQQDTRVIFPHGNSLPNVSLCEEWITPIPGLNAAMEGYDPFRADPMSQHDPGVRQKIFEPLRYLPNGRIALHSFIGRSRDDAKCRKDFKATTVKSYIEYKEQTRSSKRFSHSVDQNAEATYKIFSFKASAGFGAENTEEEQEIISFFEETSGEIIISSTECITHSVAITPFHEPVFTVGFKSAIKKLATAVNNPNSVASNSTAKDFIQVYGTHYLEETQLGAKLFFLKGFRSRSTATSQERQREECARRSAYTSFGAGITDIASAEMKYSHEYERCHQSAQDTRVGQTDTSLFVRVRSIGTFPSDENEVSPTPISFTTKKISTLMQTKWLEANSLNDINATAVQHFLEEKINSYCLIMYGRECDIGSIKCAYNSEACPPRHTCKEDPSTASGYTCVPRYGAIIIGGGSDGRTRQKTMEVLNSFQLPDLPVAVFRHTLTAVRDTLYSCGGDTGYVVADCYKLKNTDSTPRWSKILDLPTPMSYHTAVAVGTHIWFVFNNLLHDLDTVGESFRSYGLPFDVTREHCAVSNGTHSYIIGVGSGRREVWVNSKGNTPNKWHRVITLSRGRKNHACLWFGSEVYVTGGADGRADVEVLNTRTHDVSTTGALKVGRHSHEMMVLDGSPAVAGGYLVKTFPNLDSFEKYDVKTRTWSLSTRKLQLAKYGFGLAQLLVEANDLQSIKLKAA